jgi:hypothetical protein
MYNVGDSVLAYWHSTGLFHMGTIVDSNSSGYVVVLELGDLVDSLADSDLRTTHIEVGKKVLAMWTDGRLHPGTLAKVCGRAFYIHFNDGSNAWAPMMGIALKP